MGPCQPPDIANPRGYFEDVRFQRLHRSWSMRYETTPNRARLRLPPWDPKLDASDLSRYARLIQTCTHQPYWGVKDPELCYYAAWFASVLRRPIKLIATTRDLADAAASLGAYRRWFLPAECNKIMVDYAQRQKLMIDELKYHGIGPALMIDYDEALKDPTDTVQRIAAHVELAATAAAVSFIEPALRRHRVQPADTPRNEDQGVTTVTT
jgi:hypothetical protein